MKNYQKLHLGCGLNTPDDWLNLDGSWNARLAKCPFFKKILKFFRLLPQSQLDIKWNPDIFIHDLQNPLPFPDNSFSAIYASHVLEHLYLNQAQNLLKECFRVLKPNGVLRIMTPDLGSIVENYLKNKGDAAIPAASKMMEELNFINPNSVSKNFFYRIYSRLKDFLSHKWMYDEKSLIFYFKGAGFSEVKKMEINKSRIQNIEKIELNAGLIVEGVKTN